VMPTEFQLEMRSFALFFGTLKPIFARSIQFTLHNHAPFHLCSTVQGFIIPPISYFPVIFPLEASTHILNFKGFCPLNFLKLLDKESCSMYGIAYISPNPILKTPLHLKRIGL
jgi:hypothetical protein